MKQKTITIIEYTQDDVPEKPKKGSNQILLLKTDSYGYLLAKYSHKYNCFISNCSILSQHVKFTWVYAEDVFK